MKNTMLPPPQAESRTVYRMGPLEFVPSSDKYIHPDDSGSSASDALKDFSDAVKKGVFQDEEISGNQ